MSAPNPEKWKATKEECDGPYGLVYGTRKDVAKIYERIARRRALEELRALAIEECQYCRVNYPVETRSGGRDFYHIVVETSGGRAYRTCHSTIVRARIAEIEAEAE